MMNFEIQKTDILKMVRSEKYLFFRANKFLKKLFSIFFVIFFVLFLYFFLSKNNPSLIDRFFGSTLICLSLVVFFSLSEAFFKTKIRFPKLKTDLRSVLKNPSSYNLAEFLSFETAKAVWKARIYAKSRGIQYVNSDILLYFILKNNSKLNFIFSRALLNKKELEDSLVMKLEALKGSVFSGNYSEDFEKTIVEAVKIATSKNHQRIEVEDIFEALLKTNKVFLDFLIYYNLQPRDLENLINWLESLEKKISESKAVFSWKNLVKKGTLARQWTAGYTITLDKFVIDITESIKKRGFPEFVGHEQEVKSLERILSQYESKNSVLIVGEAGSGRRSIVYALCRKLALGESLPSLNYKRVVQLDLPSLIAKTVLEEAENILDIIFKETIAAGNVILVIDNFHEYISGDVKAGVIDISGVLSSYLSLPQFQLIGITTFEGLHKNVERQSSIVNLFEKVEVSEVSQQETLLILEKFIPSLEAKYRLFISYPAMRDIINMCDRYLPSLPFPEKAIDVLDNVVVYVSQKKEKVVLPIHVAEIIKEKTQIPVGEIDTKERETLLNLEKLLHQRIINQEEAIKEVSAALRRARADVTQRSGPIGAFLFLGPTGVGKTETSKALAQVYFGSERKMIRLDMSEFQTLQDIKRLLGAPGQEGLLTTPVRENPFSLILLDEFEKSHPNILNLFLQVFDEGHITDGQGRKTDFRNSILIATSNAGYQIILESLEKNIEWQQVKPRLIDFIFAKGIFRPELVNRFDAVVVFKPLTKENLSDIAELLLSKVKKNLSAKGVDFLTTKELKEKIVELSYSPLFGAREMKRVIQDKVENVLASALLSKQITKGNRVVINPQNFKLEINP